MVSGGSAITSIVLAGGRSSRLGWDKALQLIQGKSLIQWVIDCLASFSAEIIVATANGKPIPCSSPVRIETVADSHPGKGPLAGIYSGLMASADPFAVVVGCDMPFVSGDLLQHMHRVAQGYDVVVPSIGNNVEPLCAVYSRECLDPIRGLLRQNRLQIRELFGRVRVRYVGEDEFDRLDQERLSLFNVNSQFDLDRARELVARKEWPCRDPGANPGSRLTVLHP